MKNKDKTLLVIYMAGWEESGSYPRKPRPKTREDFSTELDYRAWQTGWDDYIIGDDVSSIDLQTNEEILAKIKRK